MANASQGVIELLRNPSQLQDLKSNPLLSKIFVEELCRYHTGSSMAMKRVAKEDVVLGGKVGFPFTCPVDPRQNFKTEIVQTIKAGEGIIAANASGNRDEEVFPDPDVFDMHRTPDPNHALGFGFGPHRCVAEPLARAEMELVFGKQAFLDLYSRTPSSGRSCNFPVPHSRQLLSADLLHASVSRMMTVLEA